MQLTYSDLGCKLLSAIGVPFLWFAPRMVAHRGVLFFISTTNYNGSVAIVNPPVFSGNH